MAEFDSVLSLCCRTGALDIDRLERKLPRRFGEQCCSRIDQCSFEGGHHARQRPIAPSAGILTISVRDIAGESAAARFSSHRSAPLLAVRHRHTKIEQDLERTKSGRLRPSRS
jgi:hypothetical protein